MICVSPDLVRDDAAGCQQKIALENDVSLAGTAPGACHPFAGKGKGLAGTPLRAARPATFDPWILAWITKRQEWL